MKKRLIALAIAGALATIVPAAGIAQGNESPADLPNQSQARQWIEQDPSVMEAARALEAAGFASQALGSGPYEWTARAAGQRRSIRGDGTSNEWTAQVERGVRIAGKADLDRRLGAAEIEIARARLGEARHEAARALVDLWIAHLAADRARRLATEQLGFAEDGHAAVDKRRRAGDASTLDMHLATSDLAEARRRMGVAQTDFLRARSELMLRFPQAMLDARTLGDPVVPATPEADWMNRTLEVSEALKIAIGEQRRAEVARLRAKADRTPDPTFGVYTSSENFRNERIIGLSVSIPLGGSLREARERQAFAEADQATVAVDRVRRDIRNEVAQRYTEALGNVQQWRSAEEATTAARESVRLMQRAYTLGEADLQSLLLARRQMLDTSRAAEESRATALRARYRLLVDAHRLWDLDQD